LHDVTLKNALFAAMGFTSKAWIPPERSIPSLNFGYAHRAYSWGRFIDVAAWHESSADLVFVLNRRGAYGVCSAAAFLEKIFTVERQDLLAKQGFRLVRIQDEISNAPVLSLSAHTTHMHHKRRQIQVILRQRFKPQDMRLLQLAAERLLSTGDNTAIESWAARAKIFVYEDVNNGGYKTAFLAQQIAIAQQVAPDVASLLQIFGSKGKVLPNLGQQNMQQLLRKPNLADDTLRFCEHLCTHYDLRLHLTGALKRTVWLTCNPALWQIEIDLTAPYLQEPLCHFLKGMPTLHTQELAPRSLIHMQQALHDQLQKYTVPQSSCGATLSAAYRKVKKLSLGKRTFKYFCVASAELR
jgi:hypothetical protein